MKSVLSTITLLTIGALCAVPGTAPARAALDVTALDDLKSVWDDLTPEQQREYRDLVARTFGDSTLAPRTPGDTCEAATFEVGSLPYATAADTTAETDDFNLDQDGTCDGGGNQFAGTGTGPDLAYLVQVDVTCNVSVTLTPNSMTDLALYVVTDCMDIAGSCLQVNDAGGTGIAENVTFQALAQAEYFVIVDGWADMSGTFDLDITESGSTGCSLVPVEVQSFGVD